MNDEERLREELWDMLHDTCHRNGYTCATRKCTLAVHRAAHFALAALAELQPDPWDKGTAGTRQALDRCLAAAFREGE